MPKKTERENTMYKVNECGSPTWYEIEAESHQDAVEKHFGVKVYHYRDYGRYIKVFSDLDDMALYSAYQSDQEKFALG